MNADKYINLMIQWDRNYDDEEQTTAHRAKRRRVFAVVFAFLLLLAAAVWWFLPKARMLSDSRIFSEELVWERAELILGLFDQKDQEGIQGYLTGQLTVESMEQSRQSIGSDWGAMTKVGDTYLFEIEQMGRKYAVVQMTVDYENISVVYKMFFDTKLGLEEFYIQPYPL